MSDGFDCRGILRVWTHCGLQSGWWRCRVPGTVPSRPPLCPPLICLQMSVNLQNIENACGRPCLGGVHVGQQRSTIIWLLPCDDCQLQYRRLLQKSSTCTWIATQPLAVFYCTFNQAIWTEITHHMILVKRLPLQAVSELPVTCASVIFARSNFIWTLKVIFKVWVIVYVLKIIKMTCSLR